MFHPVHRVAHGKAATSAICALLLSFAVSSGTAFAQSAPSESLSLESALRLAQMRSSLLLAQDSAATASRQMAVSAGQLPDPTLKLGINNLPVTSSDRFSLSRDFMTMRSVGVMQEFTRNDKREARAARYEREAQVADAGRTLTVANLQRETAMAWLERYYSERMREVLVQQRDEAKLQIEAADTVYRTGKGSQADVFAARSAVAQIEDRIAQADRQVLAANTRLTRWIGEAAAQSLDRLPAMDKPGVELTQLDTVVAHHPQIAVLKRQEDVAQADVVIAQTNKRADWSAELMFSQRGSAYSNMISINLSVPLQWDQRNRQDRELAAKLALVEQARAQTEEMTREHAADIRGMVIEWQSNRERLARHDNSLIPLASERTRAALAAYRGGAGSLTTVLEARRGEIDARMERLRLAMDTARLWAQLNYLNPEGHSDAPVAATVRSTP
ncbi:MAG: TolC family protein [Casimicrobium sp.]|jgi:outer membrane protein TolC